MKYQEVQEMIHDEIRYKQMTDKGYRVKFDRLFPGYRNGMLNVSEYVPELTFDASTTEEPLDSYESAVYIANALARDRKNRFFNIHIVASNGDPLKHWQIMHNPWAPEEKPVPPTPVEVKEPTPIHMDVWTRIFGGNRSR